MTTGDLTSCHWNKTHVGMDVFMDWLPCQVWSDSWQPVALKLD